MCLHLTTWYMANPIPIDNDNMATKIFSVAQSMFLDQGVRSVKMDDLSKELGISKKTLYEHIENKGDLVFQTVKREIQDHQNKVNTIISENHNATLEMLLIGRIVVKTFSKFNLKTIHELERFYPKVWNLITVNHSQFIPKVIKSNLDKGKKQGLYRKDIHVDIITKLYTNQSRLLLDGNVFPKEQFCATELFKVFFLHHMRGICTQKGIKKFEGELKKINQDYAE